MIEFVKSVSLNIADQDKALEFWTEKMGFEKLMDEKMDENMRWITVAPKGAETYLVLFSSDDQKKLVGTFSPVIFTCKNIEQTYKELVERGVEFPEKPEKQSWGWWATFKDPDGNTYGLSQI